MKKKYFLPLIAIGVIAFAVILRTFKIEEVWKFIRQGKPEFVIGYVAVSVALMLVLAWRWKIVLKSQKLDVPLYRLFMYRLTGYGISYLTPSAKMGGEPVRASLLQKHGIKFSKGLSSVVIDKTIEIAASGIFFFIGVITVLFRFALPVQTESMMLVFAVLFLTLVIFIYHRMVSGKGLIVSAFKLLRLGKINKFKDSEKKLVKFENLIIKFFQEDKKDFLLSIAISLFSWVLMFFEYKFAALIIGYNLSFGVLFLIVTFVGAAFLIPIPMALGTLEAGQVLVFSLINIKSAAGVALSLIVRARDLLWAVTGLLLMSYLGMEATEVIKSEYKNEKNKS